MITPSIVYWITRLDNLFGLFIPVEVVSVLASIFLAIAALCTNAEGEVRTYNLIKKVLYFVIPVPIVVGIILVLMPTTKEAAAMYIIPKIANNENVQDIGGRALKLANDWIDELSPKAGRTKGDGRQK